MKKGVRITVRHPLYKRPRKFVLLDPPYPAIGEGVRLPNGKTWICTALEATEYQLLFSAKTASVQSPEPPQASSKGAQGGQELTLANAESKGRKAYEEAVKEESK